MFASDDFSAERAQCHDVEEIATVYNSNPDFLNTHLGRSQISEKWVAAELAAMKEAGFDSYVIRTTSSALVMGVLDISLNIEESYLSLLMLHEGFRRQKLGYQLYSVIEEYVRSTGSRRIRIDVVKEDDGAVYSFWEQQGFMGVEQIDMTWGDKQLVATRMIKQLT